MTIDKFDLIIERLEEVAKDVKEVREKDLPGIRQSIAVDRAEKDLMMKVYTGIGTVVATLASLAVALFRGQ